MLTLLLALPSLFPAPVLHPMQADASVRPIGRTANLGPVKVIRADARDPIALLQGTAPSPERIDAAAKALETAFKEGSADARVEAIRASIDAVDKKVIDLVAKGLKEKDGKVVSAAVDALGRM